MLNNVEYFFSKIIKKIHLRSIKNSKIDKSSSIAAGSQVINSIVDRNSFCGYDCIIVNTRIGSFSSIASNCEIGGASHTIDWVSTSPVFNENKDQIKKKYSFHKYNPFEETIIGHDVWIGARCLIKSGITIGTGSVIGMGSVVTKNIPPYEIWAGNPAKFIRDRFTDSQKKELLSSEWWNFKDDKLTKVADSIMDINLFLDEIKKED